MSATPRDFRGPEPRDATSPPSTNTRTGGLLFRVVAPHLHRAVSGLRVFSCVRKSVATEAGLSVRWSAFEGEKSLSVDCRTLNAAKAVCRVAASSEPAAASEQGPAGA